MPKAKRKVKKKVVRKRSKVDFVEKRAGKPWFRKRRGILTWDLGYGWIPISWPGWILLLLLLAVNFGSVFYFGLATGAANSVIKFLTVLVLSILVFALIAMKKTKK